MGGSAESSYRKSPSIRQMSITLGHGERAGRGGWDAEQMGREIGEVGGTGVRGARTLYEGGEGRGGARGGEERGLGWQEVVGGGGACAPCPQTCSPATTCPVSSRTPGGARPLLTPLPVLSSHSIVPLPPPQRA